MRLSIFAVSLVLTASLLHGEYGHLNGMIDIPTAIPSEESFISIIPTGSFALGDDPHSTTVDLTAGLSIARRAEICLSAFTLKDYSLHVNFSVLEERGTMPALAIGVDNITYHEWVSSAGSGDTVGLVDDLGYGDHRPKEFFSAFIVATKTIGNLGLPLTATVGIGRGRFVGRGPLSKYTNSDAFSDEKHTEAIGMFGGLAVKFTPQLSGMVEYDGRDGNLGLRYELKNLSFDLAFTHLEQLRSEGNIVPRFAFGLGLKIPVLSPPKEGFIAGRVYDAYSNIPLNASLLVSDVRQNPAAIQGDYQVRVPAGARKLEFTAQGYYGKRFKVHVRPDSEVRLDVPMVNVAMKDSLDSHMSLALNLVQSGNIRLARDEFAKALAIYPDHPEAKRNHIELDEKIAELIANHRRRAIDYSNEGWIEQAIQEWGEVLKLDPSSGEATYAVDELQKKLKEAQKAQATATTKPAPTEKPSSKPKPAESPKLSAEEIEAMYNKAIMHYYNEQYEQALDILQKILKADPGNTKAKKYLDRTKRILGS